MRTTRRPDQATPSDNHRTSATTLTTWLAEHRALLMGIAALRRLGAVADTAVAMAVALPEVNRLRLSWALWDALAQGDGVDTPSLVIEYLAVDAFRLARFAVWGDDDATAFATSIAASTPDE